MQIALIYIYKWFIFEAFCKIIFAEFCKTFSNVFVEVSFTDLQNKNFYRLFRSVKLVEIYFQLIDHT